MNELRDVEAQFVPLGSLKAYDGNAKKHDSDNIDAIANSISEFGFRSPILAWHNEDGVPEIVAGHGRAAAAKKLRMEQVPVIFVDDLTDAQRRMLTLADNQTTLMTGWDDQTLQDELDALADLFDVDDLGFDAEFAVSEGDFGEEFALPDGDSPNVSQATFTLSTEQRDFIMDVIGRTKADDVETFGNPNRNGNALYKIVKEWSLND